MNETSNLLCRLQSWYLAHCNGDWEHTYGLDIGNIDNPGWSLIVELADTELYDYPFEIFKRHESEEDWVFCKVEKGKFIGYGGAENLEELLRIFLDWADTADC